MSRMADTVLKEQSLKDKQEDIELMNFYNAQLQYHMEEDER